MTNGNRDWNPVNVFIIMGALLLICIALGITAADISEDRRVENMCGPNGYAVYDRSFGTAAKWICQPKP